MKSDSAKEIKTESELQADRSAVTSALLARTGFLAGIGELQTDKHSVVAKLSETPHGRALASDLELFESTGGAVERISLTNWRQSGYGWKELFNPRGTLGESSSKSITYRRNLVDSTLDILTHNGPVGPRYASAYTVAHEAGHLDGIADNVFFARRADPKLVAATEIRMESDAIISSLRWQQEMRHTVSDSAVHRAHLAAGTLGSKIQYQWHSPFMWQLSGAEANAIANTHIKAVFGDKIGPGGVIGAYSPEQVRMRNYDLYKLSPPQSVFEPLSVGAGPGAAAGRVLGRVARIAGVAGAAYLATDLYDSFQQGPADGLRSLAKIGVDWSGWEAGVGLALRVMPYRSPLGCIVAGVVGAIATDKAFTVIKMAAGGR